MGGVEITFGDAGGDAAAWAQAVLSAIGIVFGAYIAAKVANIPTLANRHQRLAALTAIAHDAVTRLRDTQIFCDDYDDLRVGILMDIEAFDRTLRAIENVPLLDISPGTLVDGLLQLREHVARARSIAANINEAILSGATISRHSGRFVGEWLDAATLYEAAVVEFAAKASRAERRWWTV